MISSDRLSDQIATTFPSQQLLSLFPGNLAVKFPAIVGWPVRNDLMTNNSFGLWSGELQLIQAMLPNRFQFGILVFESHG